MPTLPPLPQVATANDVEAPVQGFNSGVGAGQVCRLSRGVAGWQFSHDDAGPPKAWGPWPVVSGARGMGVRDPFQLCFLRSLRATASESTCSKQEPLDPELLPFGFCCHLVLVLCKHPEGRHGLEGDRIQRREQHSTPHLCPPCPPTARNCVGCRIANPLGSKQRALKRGEPVAACVCRSKAATS